MFNLDNKNTWLTIFILGVVLLTFLSLFFTPARPAKHELSTIYIPKNTPAKQIGNILLKNEIISDFGLFRWTSYLIGLDNKYKAGTYQFSPSQTLFSILYRLSRGEGAGNLVRITFPEGYSIYRMGELMRSYGIEAGQDFAALTSSFPAALRRKHKFLEQNSTDSLEGYLFPDTYFVPKQADPETVADSMLENFGRKVIPVWQAAAAKYNLHEVITMASIIEKEAAKDFERPLIASVFFNRLANGMLLRADPTVKYALDRPGKIVTYRNLAVDSPYNTYKHLGLPPGPIANPGLASILAALNPAQTNYIYFVAKGDGSHHFSETWQGHAAAKARYQRQK
jgi:UPF0755 protein